MIEARSTLGRVAEAVAKHTFPRRKRPKITFALAAFPEGGEEYTELLATARRRLAQSKANALASGPKVVPAAPAAPGGGAVSSPGAKSNGDHASIGNGNGKCQVLSSSPKPPAELLGGGPSSAITRGDPT
jgi:hypothetical protein